MNNPSTTKFHILSDPISAPQPVPPGPEPSAAPASEAPGTPAAGGARRGRPTVYSDKVLAMMKDYARRLGFSDTAAAEGVGVSSSTISRWKKECPEIAHELQTARQECRVHHLERMMQFAEGDDNRGLRATMWLLERIFPGDYAPRMAERFAHRNFEDRNREREEEALQRERQEEAKAERAAEAQEKYLAVMAAYEAEIAQHAGAGRGRRATRRPGRRRRKREMPHLPLRAIPIIPEIRARRSRQPSEEARPACARASPRSRACDQTAKRHSP